MDVFLPPLTQLADFRLAECGSPVLERVFDVGIWSHQLLASLLSFFFIGLG